MPSDLPGFAGMAVGLDPVAGVLLCDDELRIGEAVEVEVLGGRSKLGAADAIVAGAVGADWPDAEGVVGSRNTA